jgi:DNA-binding NtrC family response regulator
MSFKLERILVLDDDAGVRQALGDFLERESYQVTSAATVEEARQAIERQRFDLVLADLILAGGDISLGFLSDLRKLRPKLPIIIFTGHASIDTALEAIKLGVFDYMLKPVNAQELKLTLKRLESIEQMRAENSFLRQELSRGQTRANVIWGNSAVIQEVLRLIQASAPTDTPVLVQGESGSGKESVARAIHEKSIRADKPFIRVNCVATLESALNVELFGEEPTKDNGIVERRIGKFDMAQGGTLFLEEVSEMPISLQTKILRVLQEKEFERVGGVKPVAVDIRIIASTNRSLKEETAREKFREDLYYRLNVFPIFLPALRDRGDDLGQIMDGFMQQLTRKHGKKITGFTPEARTKISEYSWPGNVRELFNVLERALILSAPNSMIRDEDLALHGAPRDSFTLLTNGTLPTIDDMEKRLIGLMLRQTGNNKSKAAKRLGISIRTMRNKLIKYKAEGIDVDNPENLLRSS